LNNKPVADSQLWQQLIEIMADLRGENGCPWDKEQNSQSLKKYLIEEAYEAVDAIDSNDDAKICDELGDVLLQVVFHAQLAAEAGKYSINDVVSGVNNKMIRRHPHVFGASHADTAQQVLSQWETIKLDEREKNESHGVMKINRNMPSLLLAQKVLDKAGRVGLNPAPINDCEKQIINDIELFAESDKSRQMQLIGDMLFNLVTMAKLTGIDAEDSLRQSVDKYIKRFNQVENKIQDHGHTWEKASESEISALWQQTEF